MNSFQNAICVFLDSIFLSTLVHCIDNPLRAGSTSNAKSLPQINMSVTLISCLAHHHPFFHQLLSQQRLPHLTTCQTDTCQSICVTPNYHISSSWTRFLLGVPSSMSGLHAMFTPLPEELWLLSALPPRGCPSCYQARIFWVMCFLMMPVDPMVIYTLSYLIYHNTWSKAMLFEQIRHSVGP